MKVPRVAILGIVGFVLLGGGGLLGASFVFGAPLPLGPKAAADHAHASAAAPAGVPYPMRERIVNLADPGALRYLKVSIVLDVVDPENPHGPSGDNHGKSAKPELPKDLRNKAAPIEDAVVAVLSSKTSGDLMAADGKARLKEDLKRNLNALLGGDRILAVYFTDFIIQ